LWEVVGFACGVLDRSTLLPRVWDAPGDGYDDRRAWGLGFTDGLGEDEDGGGRAGLRGADCGRVVCAGGRGVDGLDEFADGRASAAVVLEMASPDLDRGVRAGLLRKLGSAAAVCREEARAASLTVLSDDER
jgi:hypothetical protein